MSRILHPVHDLPAPGLLVDQRVFDVEPGGHVRVAATSHYKMVIVREGKMLLRSENSGPQPPLQVMPGDVILAPRKEEYSYHPAAPGCTTRFHVIRILWCPEYVAAGTKGPVLTRQGRSFFACRSLAGIAQTLRVVPLFRRGRESMHWLPTLLHECRCPQPTRERMISSLLEQLVVLLERQLAVVRNDNAHSANPDRASYLAERTKEILNERLDHHWNLHNLAWELRVGGEHLSRMFRRATGGTVFATLARLRTDRARELLLTTELSVGEIARSVGVPDLTVFGRMFRRQEGSSPSTFRDRQRSAMLCIPRRAD